jgi:hypothetical protein
MPGSEPTPSVVNEKTSFGWPVLVTISACLVAAGGGMVRVNQLERDGDVTRARVDLLERQQNADRSRLDVQAATLGEVRALVLEVRTDVREVLRSQPIQSAKGILR